MPWNIHKKYYAWQQKYLPSSSSFFSPTCIGLKPLFNSFKYSPLSFSLPFLEYCQAACNKVKLTILTSQCHSLLHETRWEFIYSCSSQIRLHLQALKQQKGGARNQEVKCFVRQENQKRMCQSSPIPSPCERVRNLRWPSTWHTSPSLFTTKQNTGLATVCMYLLLKPCFKKQSQWHLKPT